MNLNGHRWLPALIIAALVAGCGAVGSNDVAQAEPKLPDNPNCSESRKAHAVLSGFQEHVSGRGTAPGDVKVALYTARDGSTWSVLLIFPEGMSCLLIVGEAWQYVTAPQNAL